MIDQSEHDRFLKDAATDCLIDVLVAERDAALARAERAEALAGRARWLLSSIPGNDPDSAASRNMARKLLLEIPGEWEPTVWEESGL